MAALEELIRKIVAEQVDTTVRNIFREYGLLRKDTSAPKEESAWLDIVQAKLIVPIKSKKKWKELRDYAQVNFSRVGKGFLYERDSLHNYLIKNSTITKTRKNGKL